MKATKAQVFLSYAREDEEKVRQLYQELSNAGFKPWMDIKDILPGERWESCIQRAIRRSDFFLACLSANSVSKRGFLQKEIKNALDIWQEKLEDDIYLIPVRLEDCEVTESLCDFQWVDLFETDGWRRLVKAIQVGMRRRAEVRADEEPSPGMDMEGPEQIVEPMEVGESPDEANFNNVAIEILKKIAEENKGTVESLSSMFNMPEQKIQYYLDTLRARDFLGPPFISLTQPTKYLINKKGREYLVKKGLI